MGQYFKIYNHTRNEYIKPTNGFKPLESVTTPLNGATLLYNNGSMRSRIRAIQKLLPLGKP